jgi:tetratricopeptide (TPR) repeat protein
MQTDASEERLSKYELIRLLGSGGMGEVYLARDTVLRRQVAIKFVSPSDGADSAANARLLREARAVAALDHPGICPVYDVQVDPGGRTCIVMQYVEGETLAQRLSRGALDPAEALGLAAAVADALAAAHARGIIHRDLKPQNIIVTPDGQPKLLDFGIAYMDVPPAAAVEIATHTATTEWSPAAIVGTPAYMSPEQVLRQAIDGRSDLFSLGAVLFECLTGQPAFQAASHMDTWGRVVYLTPAAPSSINPRVPPAADAVVARLLAKEPADRFASALDAAAALRAAPAPPPPPWRRLAIAAVTVGAIGLVGYAGWRAFVTRGLPPPPPQAKEWYDRGVDYLRNGAYASAELALKQATAAHPAYPEALARLAEAQSELDEELEASASLVRLSEVLPNTARLPRDEARRLDAIRKVVLRDIAGAAVEYQKLADEHPQDIGVWLDLARVRQLQGLGDEARAATRKALQINADSAAAHLRLGSLASDALDRDTAIREFSEAERLYRLGSNPEGQAEALLLRGAFLNAIGKFSESGEALNAAEKILAAKPSAHQQLKAQLLRSSLLASAGDFAAAKRTAEDAVEMARANHLDTVAAELLIQVGTALMFQRDPEGEQVLKRAIALAKSRGANRVAAQGTLQLASVYFENGQPAEAHALASGMLDFLARGQYTRFGLIAKSIIARAEIDTDIRHAEQLAREVLTTAESLRDDTEVAVALEGLAVPAARLGALPEALALRVRLDQLLRQRQHTTDLAYNLTNRADLLVRLGRFAEAEEPLRELEAGAAAGVKVFATRAPRIAMIRAIAASERREFAAAATYAREVLAGYPPTRPADSLKATAEAVLSRAHLAQGQRTIEPWSPIKAASMTPDVHYWRSAALLAAGKFPETDAAVDAALKEIARVPSAEFEWRIRAIGAAAARRRGDNPRAQAMAARGQAALAEVRAAWKGDAGAYERRPDLIELKRAAGIS